MKTGEIFLSVAAILLLISFLFTDLACARLQEPFPKKALPTESGYLKIKEKPGALMFYIYHEAIHPAGQISDTPIVLWLQGGPGCSGVVGNFYELGPWRVGEDLRLRKNAGSWNRIFGLLIVDNPIGSGFSVAPSEQDIPTNEEEVAKDLFSALQAFYSLNPQFRSRPFYVTGESYAGKYVPALSYYMVSQLDKAGSDRALRIDGLAIVSGLTHPEVQVQTHAKVAYAMGLIDFQQKIHLETLQLKAASLARQQKWKDARVARTEVLFSLQNVTGVLTLDIRRTMPYYTDENGTDYLTVFVNSPGVKKALKADENRTWEVCNSAVYTKMQDDTMKSTKWMVERLLPRLPVLLFQGQFDIQDGVVSTEEWMRTLHWNGLSDFWASERRVWTLSDEVGGYVRSHLNLSHVVVAGAGHLVPFDQSLRSQVLIESWVNKSLVQSSLQTSRFKVSHSID
uniref:Carboxypeptidase n=1 Tax=Wollemia nobilis TaxID=56998 RepID=A0A0C9RTJ1_9CONI